VNNFSKLSFVLVGMVLGAAFLACVGVGAFLVIPRATDEPKEDKVAFVQHPWWRVPMTEDQERGIQLLVLNLAPGEQLWLQSNGTYQMFSDACKSATLDAALGGGGNHVSILFIGGWQKPKQIDAVRLFKDMLDKADASEESFRSTGKGHTNIDQMQQLVDDAAKEPWKSKKLKGIGK